MADNETIIVYWSMASLPDQVTKTNLMWKPLAPIFSELSKEKNPQKNTYISCGGMKNFFKNTYVLNHPRNSTIHFMINDGVLSVDKIDGINAWDVTQEQALFGRHRVSYDYHWIFFSEEELTIELMPPFLHNTADKEGGVVSVGSFDISKWFRPINADYILWEGATSLSVKEGDPAFYLRFLTNKKIILKQFDLNKELFDIISQVANHKKFFPREPLHVLYDRFISSNRHKKVLKIIKENLLNDIGIK